MSFGKILDESWTLYTRFFVHFFLIALVVFGVVNLGYAALLEALDNGSTGGSVLAGLATALASIVGLFWLQGTLVRAVVDVRDGKVDVAPFDALRQTLPFVGRLILAGLLAGLGIVGGLILLIVPGLILLTRWSLLTPAIVLEDKDVTGSLGRSNELVKGNGWTVFAIVVVTGLLSNIAGGLLQAAFSFLPRFLEILIGGTIANAAVTPFAAIALTLVFLHLRAAREEQPAAVATAPSGTA